jgi:hypothetical protein
MKVKCFRCRRKIARSDGNFCRGCQHYVCAKCALAGDHFLLGLHEGKGARHD